MSPAFSYPLLHPSFLRLLSISLHLRYRLGAKP